MTYIYESKIRKTTIFYDKDFGLSRDIEKVFKSSVKYSTSTSSSPDNTNACCCACQELIGGRLYNCSRCNSSFHSICHFPPLPINNRKVDNTIKWFCHRCSIETKLDLRLEQTILQIKDVQKREDAFNFSIIHYMSNSNADKDCGLTEFAAAIKGINAREFSLENLNVEQHYYKLPFDELFCEDEEENSSRKICFYCKKYFEARMIVCDYCAESFCFDCLNPPIAAHKNERFMCPLHVERFVDLYLINSLRVTERIGQWKNYTTLPECKLHNIFKDFYQKCKKETRLEDGIANLNKNTRNIKNTDLKKRIQKQSTFPVNKGVKRIYAKIFDGEDICIDTTSCLMSDTTQLKAIIGTNDDDHEPISYGEQSTSTKNCTERIQLREKITERQISENSAAKILLKMSESCDMFRDATKLIFNPDYFDKKLPVFAALYIISGADKIVFSYRHCLIPIQSQFVTLGIVDQKPVSINLSNFSSCKSLQSQQALIFFDKSKQLFEIVSSKNFSMEYNHALQICNLCKCDNLYNNAFDIDQGIIPPTQSSTVLWNGAVIQIGCLGIIFVGLGHF